jgi:hypothetical protein
MHDHKPNLMLRRLGSKKARYCHTRCGAVAQRQVPRDPDVWHSIVRNVEPEVN